MFRNLKHTDAGISCINDRSQSPIGGVICRIASIEARRNGTKVIYTAHDFHFYTGMPLKNWLLYYPIEWICAHWIDVLITINKEDYAQAQKKMEAKRICYVPGGGMDTDKFKNTVVDRMEKRAEISVSANGIEAYVLPRITLPEFRLKIIGQSSAMLKSTGSIIQPLTTSCKWT